MSFIEWIKSNTESVRQGKNAGTPSNETDAEEKFLKNVKMNFLEFPEHAGSFIKLKPSILRDIKSHQSLRRSDKEGSRARDAYVKIYITEDKMAAFLCAFSPDNGGADITVEAILKDLALEGIVYGIDHEQIEQIVSNKQYFSMEVAARGSLPIDGKNGQIIDFLARNEKMDIQVGEDKIVDFEKPILFRRIKKGEAICRIVPAEQGGDGSNIFGRVHSGKNGVPAIIPKGNHTLLSKDKTVLLAEIDGDIFFENGVFTIENRLVIEGNLTDLSERLEFAGDIIISGNVGDQIEIYAGGGVIIGGQVGAATIRAGTYIYISAGVNGNGQGLLEASEDVLCKMIENVKVIAGGDLYANVVNKCDITSGGSVYIKGGKGMLIGGTTRTAGSLEATRLGNQSLCVNAVSIGYNSRLNAYVKENGEKIGQIEKTLDKIKKAKLQLTSNPNLSQERKDILFQMNQQEKLYLEEKNKLELDRNGYLDRCKNEEKSFLKAESIFPLTIVTFRSKKLTISKEENHCKIFYTGNELRQIKV